MATDDEALDIKLALGRIYLDRLHQPPSQPQRKQPRPSQQPPKRRKKKQQPPKRRKKKPCPATAWLATRPTVNISPP